MDPPKFDIHTHSNNAVQKQTSPKAEGELSELLICPYGHSGRIFQNFHQLLDHTRVEHATQVSGLSDEQSHLRLQEAVVKARQFGELPEPNEGGNVTPDMAALSLEPWNERQPSPSSGKKRRADTDMRARQKRGTSGSDNVVIVESEFSRGMEYTTGADQPRSKTQEGRLYNHKQGAKGVSARRPTKKRSSERSAEVAKLNEAPFPDSQPQTKSSQRPIGISRQAGIIELQQHDPRYPGLLLQPASRPISQEQLASEVKSIYAGLGMVEQKCAHVDNQLARLSNAELRKKPGDHWQALIALHRTLLHEHHDFFLASQHPSASPALRRLAAKYTMPARMWKHGIHEFLELLRRGLGETSEYDTSEYILAFICLAYQMVALLYETVPAFEDTWIECLGDLGRYRMAVEHEDIRDRETWANVARSWYLKASDRNPLVGRLYHHLAIMAGTNTLQQVYYYGRSLSSVEPFSGARSSVWLVFRPYVEPSPKDPPNNLPVIDFSFLNTHAHAFAHRSGDKFEASSREYLAHLDNHIGRVTAKWKEQGVYAAVTNISGWFDYGSNLNIFRQLFLLRQELRKDPSYIVEELPPEKSPEEKDRERQEYQKLGLKVSTSPQPDPQKPRIPKENIVSKLAEYNSNLTFCRIRDLSNDTFALVLRRVGDKNVLPHVHVMLSFLATLAAIDEVSQFIDQAPWVDAVIFLNTLIKIESQQNQREDVHDVLMKPVFAESNEKEAQDELPLPEDYLIRGLIWAVEYLPEDWFNKKQDEEDRYLELPSTARIRSERVLRLGYRLSLFNRWISYDSDLHTFAIVS